MPQKYPPMTTHVHADVKHRIVTVVVEHDQGQSFSKGVIPRARKDFRRWVMDHIVFGKLTEQTHLLGVADTPDGRALSAVRFGY